MKHGQLIALERCPHCNIARPSLRLVWHGATTDHAGKDPWFWGTYKCDSCGRVTLAGAKGGQGDEIVKIWPSQTTVADAIPARAREYLQQAISSISAPAGAVMLTASAVDAMLKDKNYKEGSLNTRIDKAAADHLITAEMAAWAHEIRLDANDQRHADEAAPLPETADAQRAIEFANALAQFLYVLPARVERGRQQ